MDLAATSIDAGEKAKEPNSTNQATLPARDLQSAAVLEAVKARPGNVGVCFYGGATAGLDSLCARRRPKSTVGAEESLRRGRTKERRRNKKARKKALPASRASWEPFNFSNSSRSFCSRSSRSRFAWPARLTRFCNALKILWPISSARRCPSRSPRFGRRSKIDLDVGCTDADRRHVGRNVCGAGASRGITAARTLRANFLPNVLARSPSTCSSQKLYVCSYF